MIGLIAHTGKRGAKKLLANLVEEFSSHGINVLLEDATSQLIGPASGLTTHTLGRRCQLLVVLGGDGTLLQVVGDLQDNIIPLFGINTGTLGFLTCLSASAYQAAVKAICGKHFLLSRRTMLRVVLERKGEKIAQRHGLNDVVISRGSLSRLIKLEAHVNGAFLTEYSADGLIVATATGSTAYSLAAGGPIMSPDSGVFAITPICPHVMTNRTVIVSDSSVIEIKPGRSEPEVFLTVDGQELHPLTPGDVVRVSKASRELPLAILPDTTFFEILRQKLKWSGTAI